MRPVLITAGATRNPLDAIRYLSAFSSGRTGVYLAERLAAAGGLVTLLGSAEACLRAPPGLDREEYTSTRDLMARMERWISAHPAGVVIHSAAVGDYEAAPHPHKLPSGQPELVFRLTPGPKIIDHIKGWSSAVKLVSFKAASPETEDAGLHALAAAQLARTGSDLVFANVLGRLGSRVLIVEKDGYTWYDEREQGIAALLAAVSSWR